ncbi:MAG: DNA polymerase III subunit gamma/tau, partial [Ectothiorhodospiraceae bacterium]|nr:DNA polymerase III subunit gamma/tau [Ectothiorhodospiraceae bacterium]
MSYQVLARKYRPRSFAEMAGQEHVLKALINGLDNDRLHHAYLFTGTRGVGKTTVARVLAKCLNCETGVTSQPCGQCAACTEIDQGRFVDLIEVDAASRTKVEDTRDLLDNVQYAPTRGRYKIYLVDEVHMLSTHSFNALLKTLEEPPPHVKFLLATTDPQKVPVTILSRCLQFNLKRLPAELIVSHLQQVLGQEGIDSDERAVRRLARAADGSMRDALSLTDQAIAFGAGTVNEGDVRSMLGSIDDDAVFRLLEALAAENGQAVLSTVEDLSQRAPDFADVLAALLAALHELSLLQTVPDVADPAHPERERLDRLAAQLAPEDLQLFYQIALHGRRDLPLAPEPRMGFEMTLLRMLAFRPAGAGHRADDRGSPAATPASAPREGAPRPTATDQRHAARTEALRQAVAPPPPTPTPTPAPAPTPAPEATRPERIASRESASETSPAASADVPEWPVLIDRMGLAGMSKAVAMHCSWASYDNGVVRLI